MDRTELLRNWCLDESFFGITAIAEGTNLYLMVQFSPECAVDYRRATGTDFMELIILIRVHG